MVPATSGMKQRTIASLLAITLYMNSWLVARLYKTPLIPDQKETAPLAEPGLKND